MSNERITLGQEDIHTKTGEQFETLEEGLYNAVCVGITVKEMQNFDKTGMEDKIEFVFQIVNGATTYYVRSAPCKKSLHENAGLWKILASWTKQKDAQTLIDKMGTGGKFELSYFIGKPIQLMVKQKKVGDKTYPFISDYVAPKKGQLADIKFDTMPPFIVKNVKFKMFADGMTVKGDDCSEQAQEQTPEVAPPASEEASDLPF